MEEVIFFFKLFLKLQNKLTALETGEIDIAYDISSLNDLREF